MENAILQIKKRPKFSNRPFRFSSFKLYKERSVSMPIDKESLREAIDLLNDQIPLVDYYNDYVDSSVDIESSRRDCCPIHDEDSPSFHYFSDTKRFHCFGCGASGKTVDLHLALKKREYPEFSLIRGVRDLAKLYEITLPDLFQPPPRQPSYFENTHRLQFKPREALKKPFKRLLNDFMVELKKCKENAPVTVYMHYMSELELLMFLNRDKRTDIDKLTVELKKSAKEGYK